MPVTAKLSKQFYDRLGEAVTNELVDWFNQVDAAYKSDLKEINELNFARFEAKLEQRVAELRADVRGIETSLERALKEQTRFYFLAWAVLLVAIIGLWFR
jgi:predicted phage-related endonuclease